MEYQFQHANVYMIILQLLEYQFHYAKAPPGTPGPLAPPGTPGTPRHPRHPRRPRHPVCFKSNVHSHFESLKTEVWIVLFTASLEVSKFDIEFKILAFERFTNWKCERLKNLAVWQVGNFEHLEIRNIWGQHMWHASSVFVFSQGGKQSSRWLPPLSPQNEDLPCQAFMCRNVKPEAQVFPILREHENKTCMTHILSLSCFDFATVQPVQFFKRSNCSDCQTFTTVNCSPVRKVRTFKFFKASNVQMLEIRTCRATVYGQFEIWSLSVKQTIWKTESLKLIPES